ncbi:MAG: DUF3267 domain-containing protein [Chloroflexi bacterium CFX4]|nr:DUF3267 domain-containing protein [Chloroflexi bacterium CFX4]MDL1924045.1 DUF3267 domain-containing protein [Chloroflexi bacterium CFX3]
MHTVPSPLPRFAVLAALPENYQRARHITIDSQQTLVWLNVVGLGLMIGAIFAYNALYQLMRAIGLAQGANPLAGASSLAMALLTLPALFLMLSVHELIHGMMFQFFGAKPRYGFDLKKGVAFAAADRYYLTRDAYLIVGLAPLVLITLGTLALMTITSGELNTLIALIGAANIGGCVGDLWFYLICRRYPPDLLVRDFGDGAELYARAA